MAGPKSAYRARLFKGVHAEAVKRGLDHDALHDLCRTRFEVHSMSALQDGQLLALYREFTGGKKLKRQAPLPRRGEAKAGPAQLVSGAELQDMAAEFARRGMGAEAQHAFLRRQLSGRGVVRSRKDFVRVMAALRAWSRREEARAEKSAAEIRQETV